MIRPIVLSDVHQICDIYNYYVKDTIVTFEKTPVSVQDMSQRIQSCIVKYPWIVYVEDTNIIGYAYATEWKKRIGYRHSVEVSVNLRNGSTEKGIGSLLYENLFHKLSDMKVHAIIGGIALPNDSCVALHHKFGFEQVAHFREVGFKQNKWIDVVYLQRILSFY